MTQEQNSALRKRVGLAMANPLFMRVKALAPDVLLTTTPIPLPTGETTQRESGILITKSKGDVRRSWGEIVEVLMIGPCDLPIHVGDRVVISQHNGDIIIDRDGNNHRETPLMMVGAGDVMAVLEGI